MKIRTKGRIVTAVALGLIAVIASAVLWTYAEVDAANRQRQQASEIARGLSQLRLLTFEYRIYRSTELLQKWHDVSGMIDQSIDKTETVVMEQKSIIARIKERRAIVKKLFDKISERHDWIDGELSKHGQPKDLEDALFSTLLSVQQANFQDVFRLTDIATRRIGKAELHLISVALGGLAFIALITGALFWLISRSVLRPIEELERAAANIGDGNWSFKFSAGSGNEVGKLGASLNEMAARIEAQASALKTARDDLELRIQERTAAFRESEQRFRAIFEHAGIGIAIRAVSDRRLPWIQVNDNFSNITGYSKEELLRVNPVDITAPEHQEKAIVDNEGLKRGEISSYVREKQIIRRDGRKIWVSISVASLPGPDGSPENLIATYQDVNLRHEADTSIRRLNRVYAVLSGINLLISRVHDLPILLSEACRIAVDAGNFPLAWIGRHDLKNEKITPIAWAGEHGERLAKIVTSTNASSSGVTGRALIQKKPVFSNDLTAETENMSERRREAIRLGYLSVIGLPLIVDGAAVGSMTLYAREADFFDEQEVSLLTELASNVSIGMEGIARREKLEKLSRIRAVSAQINATIVRIRDQDTLLRETCNIAFKYGGFELIWIGMVDRDKEEVRSVAWSGFPDSVIQDLTWQEFGAGRGTIAEALGTGEAYVRRTLEGDLPVGALRGVAIDKGYSSSACLPLEVDASVSAMIILFAREEAFFDEDELALLRELSADVSFALQSIRDQKKLNYLSFYAPLTGLPNRAFFMERVNQHMRARSDDPRMVALMLVNIERFRFINETFGRHGGDEILKGVAKRLAKSFGGMDSVAHIDSDSFGVVVRGIHDSSQILHILHNQVLSCFAAPFAIDNKEIRVAAKVGVAVYPADGEDADRLYRNAEAALKMARASGERHLFYASEMNARAAQTLTLETKLRKAVESQQFVLHYQPKYSLADGRMSGMEALIRWQDPASGLVSPGLFIPLLEETGLILEVGQWALNEALRQHRAWILEGLPVPRIAVNVSAIQLQQKNFANVVIDVVQEQGDNADALELEVTESLLMRDVQASLRTLSVLRGLGITIAMDDFGTGYSSLAYIARLPITSLKIDRAFITGMTDGAQSMNIVTTIVALAHSMELKVVAEGVETEQQAQLLKGLKCDEVQGYLFSKPVPAADLRRLLTVEKSRG